MGEARRRKQSESHFGLMPKEARTEEGFKIMDIINWKIGIYLGRYAMNHGLARDQLPMVRQAKILTGTGLIDIFTFEGREILRTEVVKGPETVYLMAKEYYHFTLTGGI